MYLTLYSALIFPVSSDTYTHLTHPLPAPSHAKYPWYTAGGGDKRWVQSDDAEEQGLQWVGGLMSVIDFFRR